MSDFEEKLNQILSDEAAMGQIMSLARSISGEGESQKQPPQPESPAPEDGEYTRVEPPEEQAALPPAAAAAPAGQGGSVDLGAILQMLGSMTGGGQQQGENGATGEKNTNPLSALESIDPRIMQLGMRVLKEYSRTDDQKVALLMALKPFVKEERYAKVDRAMQIARLSRVIRVALEALRESRESGGREGV